MPETAGQGRRAWAGRARGGGATRRHGAEMAVTAECGLLTTCVEGCVERPHTVERPPFESSHALSSIVSPSAREEEEEEEEDEEEVFCQKLTLTSNE